MLKIKSIEKNIKLREVFNFMSKTLYEDAKEYNEHYYPMSERFTEMSEQFKKDNSLLLYIEDNGEIIAALTSKGMNKEKQKITIGVMAVSKNHRRKGYGKALIEELEKRCFQKDINHIDLGARFRACPLYLALKYKPSLMVQGFDFTTIEDVKKANTLKLKSVFEWQGDTYGYIFFDVDSVKEEYINHFESKIPTAHTQFIFEKNLVKQKKMIN